MHNMMRYAIVILLLAMTAANARPPAGTDLNGAEHRWWECQRQNKPPYTPCCSLNDGHVLGDGDWRSDKDGYRVRIEHQWWQVPPETVINPGLCGPEPNADDQTSAKIWYAPSWDEKGELRQVLIYCFEPGVLY